MIDRLALVFVALIASLTPLPQAAAAEEGFRPIFDGRTLDGWTTTDASYWSVQEGAITARISREHPLAVNRYLVWNGAADAPGGQLADFELKLSSRLRGEGPINNGFQFRSRLLPDGDVAGYQVDNNLNTPWLARLYDEFGRHDLALRGQRTTFGATGKPTHEAIPDAAGKAWFDLGAWHEYHLICQGPTITLKIDGRLAAEVIDNDPRRFDAAGILALQIHSGPPTVAQFKDVRVKVLKAADALPATRPAAEARREALFADALGRWDLATGGHAIKNALTYHGRLEHVELNVLADGPGARPGARVAVLSGGHFDAGKRQDVEGEGVTVYLRARDPAGRWDGGLLAKRGSPERANYNLYSAGGMIGFEVAAEGGAAGVRFPAAEIDAKSWHDLVGRYDGRAISLLCDGKVVAERKWAGGRLRRNDEPLLIGAETDGGKPVRPFAGDVEEAAVWARALSDAEVGALSGSKGEEQR